MTPNTNSDDAPRPNAHFERMQRAEELFHTARALPSSDRATFLARSTAGDAKLSALVERLLARHTDAQVLDRPVLELGPAHDARATLLPERIGRYAIQRVLGEGGMGSVYEALQDEPRRTVALKVLRPASSSPELLARFRREARVLGSLQHPGIAQVHEAGTGELVVGGQAIAEVPFIAMELVRGDTLQRTCERAGLSIEARLDLFARVCDAVAYAHAQGVVHRDLKPGNILVAELGTTTTSALRREPATSGASKPSSATGSSSRHAGSTRDDARSASSAPDSERRANVSSETARSPTSSTRGGERTSAAHLAPKVLDFGIARLVESEGEATVSTRTGQVLGTLAYMSPEQARGDGSLVDARADVWALGVILYELLAETRPFALDGLPLATAARRIQDDEPKALGTIDARLSGDLETIVGKALEKDPARRYANAAEFAADVRRHLAHEPITARPPSATYLVAKFARRNKALVLGFAAALVALVGGLGYGLVQARAERDEAQLATAFLAEMLGAPDPMKGGKGITMVEVVRRSIPELQRRFAGKPLLRARLSLVLGGALVQDDRDAARTLITDGESVLARELGASDPETLHARAMLAMLDNLALDFTRAGPKLAAVAEAQAQTLGSAAYETLMTQERLADSYLGEGRLEDAVKLYREVLATYERTPAAPAEGAHSTRIGLANALVELGQRTEAEALLRSAFTGLVELRGREHPTVLDAADTLSIVLSETGKLDEAEAIARENLAIFERLLGKDDPKSLNVLNTLAGIEVERTRYAAARTILRDLLERSERANGPDNPDTLTVLNTAAQVELRDGHPADAEPLFRELCERTRRSMGSDHWYTWAFQTGHAAALLALDRDAEAEPLLVEAYEECTRLLGDTDERTRRAAQLLTTLCEKHGRAEDAKTWSARAGR
ncbi:MAG: tetratricopeptide repeat protein [Planctomycetes bacterium]|nr:tetratricopeptide repeat protein [Planctomycetota bacterium]